MVPSSRVKLIAAVGLNGEIGHKDRLPWHVPEDLRFFKLQTTNDVVIVGRKTYSTLPDLEDRVVVGMSRSCLLIRDYGEEYTVPHSGPMTPDAVVRYCMMKWPDKFMWVAGGAEIYRAFLEARIVHRSHITHIPWTGEADTYFPFDAFGGRNANQDREEISIFSFSRLARKIGIRQRIEAGPQEENLTYLRRLVTALRASEESNTGRQ